jgi:type I restriction enzyme M protein
MGKRSSSRRKALGQFWTPPAVVDFMLELVEFNPLWKVIDPACGEGVFLWKALERGCGAVAGVDMDPAALERARDLLRDHTASVRLYCQDGLAEIQDENAFWRGDYDLVVGNPPFAASGARVRDPQVLRRFQLARVPVGRERWLGRPLLEVEVERPKPSQAIEVLFLERFLQLCKPGGRVCIILPEGIFANASLRHVRSWLVQNFTVRAVIGLPRDTFRAVGTTAKTAILYVEKRPPTPDHSVLLVEVTRLRRDRPGQRSLKENSQLLQVLEIWRSLSPVASTGPK